MYDTLVGIRNDLEKLSLTQAWSLRETDLYDFQRQLDKFDEARVDGNWYDEEGKPAELYVQRVSFGDCDCTRAKPPLITDVLYRHSSTSFAAATAWSTLL